MTLRRGINTVNEMRWLVRQLPSGELEARCEVDKAGELEVVTAKTLEELSAKVEKLS